MEQRIGSKSQPLDAAAVNPAHIPGLTSPVPAEPNDAVEETEEAAAEETVSDAAVSADDSSDSASGEEAEETEEAEAEEAEAEEAEAEEAEAEEAEAEEADPDGPVFEASDRRASITADHKGIRLRLDDQECEFRWDEIGAVETEAPRFGKRFTVTVHTPDRRWYPVEIEAKAKSQHKEWEAALDEVLDAYFEEGAEAEAPDAEAPDAEAPAEESAP
ncbi:hypothetical protein [Streptomyces albiflavescens]|uniref:hypothetical protein n=1 Tax=Streptomyces albiflavescens TaxID=1623582 RepID=UPI00166B0F85|nr:hypothetical protein [Streptomyces albiflavescens]